MPSLRETISRLGENVTQIVTDAVSSGRLTPGEQAGFRWNIANFTYDDSGVVVGSATGDYVKMKTWFRAWEVLEPEIKAQEAFKGALSSLKEGYPSLPVEEWVGKLVREYIDSSLPTERETKRGHDLVDRFLNDLEGGPVTFVARVFLQGIVLRSETIEVAAGVRIRRPQKEEFEAPITAELAEIAFPQYPSAIVDLESVGHRDRSPHILQLEVERCVALLRLFGVGSAKWMRYRMESRSIVQRFLAGELKRNDRGPAREKYIITGEDKPKLRLYWQIVAPKLPTKIFDATGVVSHVTLAYDRYSDAVLNNGVIERRIANAVMGLEALFLAEIQELSYRLGTRVAKLVSLLTGKSALEIRAALKYAYGVRNKFAHGGHLTPKEERKVNQRYGSAKALLLILLEYLRVSILAFIVSGISKDSFISLLDDALLDEKENMRLKEALDSRVALIV